MHIEIKGKKENPHLKNTIYSAAYLIFIAIEISI